MMSPPSLADPHVLLDPPCGSDQAISITPRSVLNEAVVNLRGLEMVALAPNTPAHVN